MSTKETLLDKALDLFSQNGFDGVSVRQIAKAAGITEGSIYNHFPSKQAILDEIFAIHAKQSEAEMPTGEMLISSYQRPDWKPFWEYRIQMFEQNNPAFLDLRISKLLSSEQYRSPEAANIILAYYLEGPMNATIKLLDYIKSTDPTLTTDSKTLALLYLYPLFTLNQEYAVCMSVHKDPTEVIQKMKNHVRFFWHELIKRKY